MADKIFVGRRKKSIARVYLRSGSGNITVNKREFEQFFPLEYHREDIKLPLIVSEMLDKYDAYINVNGGGVSGQAEAARLGIARALVDANPDLRMALKAEGLLRRDPRMVERKKYGQPKARKRFQFSKR